MGKLHRIDITRFFMDAEGEIVARLGMSIICKVETGWGQEGDPVGFYYQGQKLAGPETYVGDIVFMEHDGPRTSWVLGKKPRDPRLSLLWEFGYRSATRIRVEETTVANVAYELRAHAFGTDYTEGPNKYNWAWNDDGCFIGDGFSKPTIVKDNSGRVLVALYSGRVFNHDTTYCNWFMADKASIADVKSALLADNSLNKRSPLLQ